MLGNYSDGEKVNVYWYAANEGAGTHVRIHDLARAADDTGDTARHAVQINATLRWLGTISPDSVKSDSTCPMGGSYGAWAQNQPWGDAYRTILQDEYAPDPKAWKDTTGTGGNRRVLVPPIAHNLAIARDGTIACDPNLLDASWTFKREDATVE